MSLLEDVLRQPAVIRLGWTLVHFLWQGAAVALAVAAVLWFMRRHSAEARYAIACGALALIAVCPVVTYTVLPQQRAADSSPLGGMSTSRTRGLEADKNVYPTPERNGWPAVDGNFRPTAERITIFHRIADRLLPWLVVLWGAGVLVLSVRLLGGYAGVQRARREATEAPHPAMQRRLAELARRMGVTRPVRLLQSARIAGPAVVGILKPVILFPTSALTGMWPIQIEAILAHELAHIQRHDYLINVLQSIVETLLFYHPAVWWLSNRIRQEREHCCDDVAAEACGDRVFYASSLAELDEMRGEPLALAMAANGMGLLPRIRRILRVHSKEVLFDAWTSGTLAGTLAVAVAIILVARSSVIDRHRQSTARTPIPTAGPVRVVSAAPRQPVLAHANSAVGLLVRRTVGSRRQNRADEFLSDFDPPPAAPAANARAASVASDGPESWARNDAPPGAGSDFGDFRQAPDRRGGAASGPAQNGRPRADIRQPAPNVRGGIPNPVGPMFGVPGIPGPLGMGGDYGMPYGGWGNLGVLPWYGSPPAQSPPAKKAPPPAPPVPAPPVARATGSGGSLPPREWPQKPVKRPGPVRPAADRDAVVMAQEEPAAPDFIPPTLRLHTISPASGVIVQPADESGARAVRIVVREQPEIREEGLTRPPAALSRQAAFQAAPRATDPSRGRSQR